MDVSSREIERKERVTEEGTVREIEKMTDVIMREIEMTADTHQAVKHLARFIKDLDEVATSRHPFYYIYRDHARSLKNSLVNIILEVF